MDLDANRPVHPEGLTARDIMIACVMNVMWGLNLIAVKMGVDLVSPLTAAWLRQVMVLVICLPGLKIIPGRMRELLLLGVVVGCAVLYFREPVSGRFKQCQCACDRRPVRGSVFADHGGSFPG